MPRHNFEPPRGRIERLSLDSTALAGNLVGDPATRQVAVYLPVEYTTAGAPYPLFVGLAGFTGSGLKQLNWQAFGESLPQRLDRLVAAGRMGPVVVALPDAFTSLGGNQYVNSTALGRWEEFLLDEMIPCIEQRFHVRREPQGRAVFGKSSGGYGALIQALKHGSCWGAAACHSGDIGFETVYLRDLPRALDALAQHGGKIPQFLERLREAQKIGGAEFYALMLLAMAATYDPDPAAPYGIRLPVDPHTAELIPARWANWLAHDPLRLIDAAACQASLRRLGGLFIDCGSRDEYFLHYGARAFVRKLRKLGLEHRYEEFDDDHANVDYRLDVSLPFLYERVAGRP